mmetsp:Transcript_20711/g.57229  ORF Transcript_20711/g.57229 Transcript_20711/m.57229 type:complete len:80 (+) Transcript_20711:535-774(+)
MAKTLPWKVKIAALRKFKELEGHTMVRQSYVDPDTGFRLGRWVANIVSCCRPLHRRIAPPRDYFLGDAVSTNQILPFFE